VFYITIRAVSWPTVSNKSPFFLLHSTYWS